MGMDNVIFLEVIEWFDPTGKEMVHRIPEKGSGEIKFGAQLTVRESQVGVFFYKGKAIKAFGPGRHTLKTGNIPILNKIMAIPWGMTSPLRAEVYFVNMKTFPDLRWGTRDPVAFKDDELGLIRLRAHGQFNIRVVQPLLFVNALVGTVKSFSTPDIEEYLGRVIVSRFNDHMGEKLDTIFNLPGQYDEWSGELMQRLQEDLSHFGLGLTHLYINAITPPPEVQKAIDDRSRMGVFDDMGKLMQMKAAMAMEKAAENEGEAGSGMGLGVGFMMPAMLQQFMGGQGKGAPASQTCPDCKSEIGADDQFCPQCGHQMMVFNQCPSCSKNLPPHARFCSRCGQAMEQEPQAKICPSCKAENLPQSAFCNQCGERL